MGERAIEPVRLTGRVITLEPLEPRHSAGLFASASPELFQFLLQRPHEWSLAGFEALVGRLLSQPRAAWAIVLNASGRVVGSTSYLNIRPDHKGLEIGTTWIAKDCQGTAVNPESKRLLIGHAIETLGYVRVDFLVSILNVHSQAAVAKLGAVREGVLRNRWMMPSGEVRDAVSYSITPGDWPMMRARLDERIGGLL